VDLAYVGPAAQQGSNILDLNSYPRCIQSRNQMRSDATVCIGSDTVIQPQYVKWTPSPRRPGPLLRPRRLRQNGRPLPLPPIAASNAPPRASLTEASRTSSDRWPMSSISDENWPASALNLLLQSDVAPFIILVPCHSIAATGWMSRTWCPWPDVVE
jgi:hypothetical protein